MLWLAMDNTKDKFQNNHNNAKKVCASSSPQKKKKFYIQRKIAAPVL